MLLKELTLNESKSKVYEVTIGRGWEDVSLAASDIQDISKAIMDRPRAKNTNAKSIVSELTNTVAKYIGAGPGGNGEKAGVWHEVDFEVQSEEAKMLVVKYRFSGFNKYSTDDNNRVTKKGIITITPKTDTP